MGNGTQQGRETRDKIYQAIKAYHEEHGYPPTRREIGKKTGLRSSGTIQTHLLILKEQGRIYFEPLAPRTLRVLDGKEKEDKPVKGKKKFKIVRTFAADFKRENRETTQAAEEIRKLREEIKKLRDLLNSMEL
jgi:hypothetical protein